MNFSGINSSDIIFSLDIGTRSVIGTVGVVREKKFHVLGESYIEHEERAMIDGQIHDISLVAKAVSYVKSELEKQLNLNLTKVAIAAAGRFLRTTSVKLELDFDNEVVIDKEVIKSLELSAVKKAEEEVNRDSKGKLYCVGYSVKSYFLNGYVISNLLSHKGENIGVEIIATFLPRSVVDSLYSVMNRVNLEVISLTLEPIAAIEAAIPQNLRLLNLALVDIGAGTSDIAISSKDSIVAYGMVPMAGDEVTEIIAQTLLVDFNTAERIKREWESNDSIKYCDVLGLENEVSAEEVVKIVLPVVDKICEEISKGIISLNGGKSPNAVFLVGGGAHTPKLRELLAEKLNLQAQRVGIKGRDAVTECICLNNELGSTGVTVLGIALVSIKQSGHDFINVTLNDTVVSLFNSHKHNVMDVLMQAGINSKLLIGKNGKNIRFTVNGAKRLAFGTLAENARIMINEELASMDSEVKDGDVIDIKFAQQGKEAEPKILEYLHEFNGSSFYYNENIFNLEPICYCNGVKAPFDYTIRENDEILIIYPSTLEEFIKYYLNEEKNLNYYIDNKLINKDYIIKEGDRIYSKDNESSLEIEEPKSSINTLVEIEKDASSINSEDISKQQEKEKLDKEAFEKSENEKYKDEARKNEMKIVANGKPIILMGKDKYIFIDIFDFIEFDLTRPRGNIVLKLNEQKAGYFDDLNQGDIVEIYWE